MEARKFKLSYFPRTGRYLHSVKSVDTPAIGTFISASHVKMTPDTPIALILNLVGMKIFSSILNPTLYGGVYPPKQNFPTI